MASWKCNPTARLYLCTCPRMRQHARPGDGCAPSHRGIMRRCARRKNTKTRHLMPLTGGAPSCARPTACASARAQACVHAHTAEGSFVSIVRTLYIVSWSIYSIVVYISLVSIVRALLYTDMCMDMCLDTRLGAVCRTQSGTILVEAVKMSNKYNA